MGIKRVVDTDLWTDEKIEDFTPEEKYFWVYLLTNPYTRQLGIYHITKKQMAFQLGYDVETVTKLLDRFENEHKLIKYIDSEIAIFNFLKRQILKGGKPVEDCLNADIKSVKHRSLIRWVFDGIDPSKVNSTVMSVVENWKKESTKERIIHNDNDNDNDSIVATIRPRYVHDSLFEQTLKDFEEMRRKIKKPLTDKAKELLIKKLEELAPNDTEKQIKIMEQSIVNCWQGVYGLKEEEDDLRSRTREAYIKDVEMKERREQQKGDDIFYDTTGTV